MDADVSNREDSFRSFALPNDTAEPAPQQPTVNTSTTQSSASAMGKLTLTILSARGIPGNSLGGFWMQTNAYACASITPYGRTRFRTPALPGSKPAWGSTFEFEVYM